MWVIILAIAIIVLLLTPIKIDCYLYYDKENRILTSCAYLYGGIKIVGGYFERIGSKVFFHYANRKATVIKIGDMRENKIKLKDLSSVKLKTIMPIISLPNDANSCVSGSAIAVLSGVLLPNLFGAIGPDKAKTKVLIGRDKGLKIYIKLKFSITIIAVIITTMKIRMRNEN